jgi:trimethylamine:corrinoid methyltransferase-like protein
LISKFENYLLPYKIPCVVYESTGFCQEKESIRALKGLTGGVYQPLSPADIETIHQTSLKILENTGFSYESGLEATIDMLATMGGSNFIHHAAGMLESMLTVAYEQYVIDDKIIGMCCRVLQGIEVDAEHLALEAIDSVGPGGNFIASDHTFAHMRTEYFTGNGVRDRKIRDDWEQYGSQDAATRAREIARTILAQEEKSYIPADIAQAICKKYNIIG